MQPLLSARGLSVTLPGGIVALSDVDIDLNPGEVLAVLGPNGAGKSTLARAMAGLLAPSAGATSAGGRPLASLRRAEVARLLAHVPQELPADLPFTAAEVALMGRAPHLGPLGLEGPEDRARAAAALERLDVLAAASRPLFALSGGERRRVLLARVLVQEAPAWILDEPMAHLDLAHQMLVFELAREHAGAGGAALLVLHEIAQAARCDRVALLDRGRLVAVGPPGEVLTPEILMPVFRVAFARTWHPVSGEPVLLPG